MKNKVVLIKSNSLGHGDQELGETILETFLTLVKQRADKPYAVFLMNQGVELTTELSLCHVHLLELQKAGVKILACTTCLNHYRLLEKQIVGVASTMGEFIELASKYETITL